MTALMRASMSTTASVVVVATSVVVVVSSAADVVVSIVVGAATDVELSLSSVGVALEHATRAEATSNPPSMRGSDRGMVLIMIAESELAPGVIRGPLIKECCDSFAVVGGRHGAHHGGGLGLEASCQVSIE
jgi:hypothetical protein